MYNQLLFDEKVKDKQGKWQYLQPVPWEENHGDWDLKLLRS